MNVTLVKQSISHTRTREPSSLVALAMNGMVKKKKKVSSCFELKKKKNTSVTKPQRGNFKQKKNAILKQLR